jgi:hypothetical protein
MTSELGGNLIRLFYSVGALVAGADAGVAAVFPGTLAWPEGARGLPLEERLFGLDRSAIALEQVLAGGAHSFDFALVDAYTAGVEAFNREAGGNDHGVRVLLTIVSQPPRWIVESPSRAALAANGRAYTYYSLWSLYLRVHDLLHRALAQRYVTEPAGRGETPVVCAFELGNEPDYCWIPAEMKIELGIDTPESALWKYVTELHLVQIPEREGPPPAADATPTGFQAQALELVESSDKTTAITEFDWGVKFDWYVKCFAELHQCIGESLVPAREHYPPLDIVSGAVTHSNIDYLLRMARASPTAFEAVSAVGIHPYHWVHHDVWNSAFVNAQSMQGWQSSSPREYADSYFKRFDFLQEIAACTRAESDDVSQMGPPPPELVRAFKGKKLWLTEFGIGTKALGAFNASVAEFTRFIRPRANIGAAAGYDAEIWEDLWDAFLDQVDVEYLDANQVGCFLLYALREAGTPSLDMDDDDRSNLAVLKRDGSPRLDPQTLSRLSALLGNLAGRTQESVPPITRPGLELHRQPWRSKEPPAEVFEPPAMLFSAAPGANAVSHPRCWRRRRCCRSRSASCWRGWPSPTGRARVRSSTAAASSEGPPSPSRQDSTSTRRGGIRRSTYSTGSRSSRT